MESHVRRASAVLPVGIAECLLHPGWHAESDLKTVMGDITIWSFPLYYFTVSGGLKNLIDRQLPMVESFMVENETQTDSGSIHPDMASGEKDSGDRYLWLTLQKEIMMVYKKMLYDSEWIQWGGRTAEPLFL